ncbi:AbiJ-NTD4 domain-containing protein [Spongiimicrobium sp. 2-473A-2-J]|uniref:AbiJ-NTD4 domain-containing protein n=1 Tax=Eudoraea algarum TaxID=3417568 RepID=UPI003D369A4C
MKIDKNNLPFAKRYGFEPVEIPIQIDHIDDDLRTDMWNAFLIYIYGKYETNQRDKSFMKQFFQIVWIGFFKEALDDFPYRDYDLKGFIRRHIEKAHWPKVYEFFEFVLQQIEDRSEFSTFFDIEEFSDVLNENLKDNNSAYTLVETKFIPVTNEAEISEIEQTQILASEYGLIGIHEHLNTALELISKKPNPDLRNSIKEGISMVEAISRIIEPTENTLGKALNKLNKSKKINNTLKAGFEKLYAYTNDKNGIRHALMQEDKLELEDARFFLVSCSAFTNYLIEKAKKEDLLGAGQN